MTSDMTDAGLELLDVSKRFGGVYAVVDVNVGFDKGRITCIIGPNGAGKTTLFNLICGAFRPDAGQIRFNGRPIAGLPTHQVARLGVGRLFQDVRVFGKMTAIENVCASRKRNPGENVLATPCWPLIGGRSEAENRKRALDYLTFVGLDKLAGQTCEQMSYGQQKLVAIARLLNNDATCLLLDEPTAGVHPGMIKHLLDTIRKLADQDRTVVIIEHNLGIVREIGDWVYLMDRGSVEAFGTPIELLRDASLKRLLPVP